MNKLGFTSDYFTNKKNHERKQIFDISEKNFEALQITQKVVGLCYPWRFIKAVHCYYDNTPIEPFMLPELQLDSDLQKFAEEDGLTKREKKQMQPIKDYIVIDVYFLFGDSAYPSQGEQDAFMVEVAFPVGGEKARWASLARVRWIDLAWPNKYGAVPVAELMGEIYVNAWSA